MLRGMEVIGIDQARKTWGDVVNHAHYGKPVLTTRTGKPWSVTISYEMAKELFGLGASTVNGAEYGRLLRELREAANGTEET